jgi:hypothetical protein
MSHKVKLSYEFKRVGKMNKKEKDMLEVTNNCKHEEQFIKVHEQTRGWWFQKTIIMYYCSFCGEILRQIIKEDVR